MTRMPLFGMWRHRLPAGLVVATTVIILAWPAIPLRGIENWAVVYANTTYLLVLYPLVALLSGVVVGLFAFQKWVAPGCSVGGSAKIGATGSFVGIFLGACPACIPAIAVLLPLGVNVFLSRVAPIFAGLSVAILLFAIYRMSGFRLVSGQ